MDDSGIDHEEDLFEMIRHSENPEIELDHDDGSQYLNESGEGMFEGEPRDEGHNQNNDDEENDLQLTKSGEVYIRLLMISLHVVID